MPHGTHGISSKGNGEGKSAQGSPPLPFLLYVKEPSPTKPLRPRKHSERHKMRCRLHRTDKREAHYKDEEAAVRSLPGGCPPYGSIYVHLLQRSASVIAARCIVLRSAVRLSHDLGAASAGLACLRMSGSPACIHQMTDKSVLCSCPCPRATLVLGTEMLRHLPESFSARQEPPSLLGRNQLQSGPGAILI